LSAFAKYNGDYWVGIGGSAPAPLGDELQLRLRLAISGSLPNGRPARSDTVAWELDTCRDCGPYDAAAHSRAPHPPSTPVYCY
jgi:hypothetical protein